MVLVEKERSESMSKYIIEVGNAYTKHICGKGDMLCLPVRINEFEDDWLNTNIPLTPYTEPDTSEAYQQGYEEGYAVGEAKKNNVKDEAYKRGAEDMRKALRLLIDCDDDCLTIPDIFKAFGEGSYHAVVRKHPAMEIIEKILAYEQKQKQDGLRQNIQTIVDQCGYTLDEIAAVLEKMRGEKDG